jgi:protein TonB
MVNIKNTRVLSIAIAAAIHISLLLLVVVSITASVDAPDPHSGVMKLADIQDRPAERAPEPERKPETNEVLLVEDSAETFIETNEIPEALPAAVATSGAVIDFLPMHLVSELPKFSEDELRRNLPYPAIAQRAGIEGIVYLELFVDNQGNIRNINILKEDPPGRGFGEAAARAFNGLHGVPAVANGENVAVKYRYPVRFRLR